MTGQGFSYWLFEKQNWLWVVAIPMAAVILPLLIYSHLTVDDDLWYRDRRDKIADVLDDELKSFEMPEKTAVINREKLSRSSSIFISTEYRTELASEDFLKIMDSQLRARGWIYRTAENEGHFYTYRYCRGRFDANMTREGWRGIWDDGSVHWSIFFTYYGRSKFGLFGDLPDGCRE